MPLLRALVQNDGATWSAVTIAHFGSREQEVRFSPGRDAPDIVQELDADHFPASERPIGHQCLSRIDSAQVRRIGGDTTHALLFEILDRRRTQRGPTFALPQ